MNSYNINPHSGPLSKDLFGMGIFTLTDLINYVQELPYGRNSDRENFNLVLIESKGTCSTKHAFVCAVDEENNWDELHLFTGIYMMHEENTKGVGIVLDSYGLTELPEAHCVIIRNQEIVDLTFPKSKDPNESAKLQNLMQINTFGIGKKKEDYHKKNIKNWIEKESIDYNLSEIWKIREQCIRALSYLPNSNETRSK